MNEDDKKHENSVSKDEEISIIFLDIDGVLLSYSMEAHRETIKCIIDAYANIGITIDEGAPYGIPPRPNMAHLTQVPRDEWLKAWVKCFNKKSVDLLNKLCDGENNVRIIVSSTWRTISMIPDILSSNVVERLKSLWEPYSWSSYIISVTPTLSLNNCRRAEEIQQWLDNNKDKYNIKSFVILDDVANESGLLKAFPDNFVHTNDIECFNEADYDKVCIILNKD